MLSFNLSILECKSDGIHHIKDNRVLALIYPYWNVNEQRWLRNYKG